MSTHISMLRGINVSGQKIIKMTDLKALYESAGFKDVATYIQSGNVVFKSKESDPAAVSGTIVKAIEKKYGYRVTIVIREPKEMAAVIKKNPFVGKRGVDEEKLYVGFLEAKPDPALVKGLEPLTAKSRDEYRIIGKEIYMHFPGGMGKTLFSNNFFEKHLKVAATTRNWNTVNTLCSMASD